MRWRPAVAERAPADSDASCDSGHVTAASRSGLPCRRQPVRNATTRWGRRAWTSRSPTSASTTWMPTKRCSLRTRRTGPRHRQARPCRATDVYIALPHARLPARFSSRAPHATAAADCPSGRCAVASPGESRSGKDDHRMPSGTDDVAETRGLILDFANDSPVAHRKGVEYGTVIRTPRPGSGNDRGRGGGRRGRGFPAPSGQEPGPPPTPPHWRRTTAAASSCPHPAQPLIRAGAACGQGLGEASPRAGRGRPPPRACRTRRPRRGSGRGSSRSRRPG